MAWNKVKNKEIETRTVGNFLGFKGRRGVPVAMTTDTENLGPNVSVPQSTFN